MLRRSLSCLFFLIPFLGIGFLCNSPFVQAQQSPEEIGPRGVNDCISDLQCPKPKATDAQEQSCLVARCVDHQCTVGFDTGALIDRITDPVAGSCFAYRYECSSTGEAVVRKTEAGKIATNEGEVCTPETLEDNVCVAYTCSNKRCVRNIDKLNGGECPRDRAISKPNPCQKTQCLAGECSSVADSSKAKTSCGDDVVLPDGCQLNTSTCNATGRCIENTVLKAGAECGPPPNNLIAQSDSLPASFKNLFLNASQPPLHSCNGECRLEYCGDGIRNGSESCDGSDLPSTVPRGSRCSSDCKVASPDCTAYANNPNFIQVPNINGNGSVTIPNNGSFSGLLSEVHEILTKNSYVVEVAWEPGYTQGITGPDALTIHALALCAWKPETKSECNVLKDKKGFVVTALGIAGIPSCKSAAAQVAYDKFRQDYRGYQSLFTGNNVGFSIVESENYIYPFRDPSVGPEEMKYCEVCYYPECGNGVRTPDEQCDRDDLGPDAQPGDVCSSTCILESCQVQSDPLPTCSVDPVTGEGIETRKTFSLALCGFEEATEREAKPATTCTETVLGKTAIKSSPAQFVLRDGSCQWEKRTETISSPFTPTCSVDPSTGNGVQTGSAFNSTTCQWADGKVIRPKPAPSCTETVKGKTAVLRTATRFIQSAGGCAWEASSFSSNSNVTPGCMESGNHATLTSATLESNVKVSPPICRFKVTTSTKGKPADNCVEEKKGASFYATKNTYTFNRNTCDYVASPKSIAKPSIGCREISQRVGNTTTYSAEATTYTFNAAKCAYAPSKLTIPKPAPSCTEENQSGKTYAVSRAQWSLNATSCAYKTSERKTPKPSSATCSPQNGQRYVNVTLDSNPNRCSYSTASGSCCGYTLSTRAGLISQSGKVEVTSGAQGCLGTVVGNATLACRGAKDLDDCVAGRVSGTWSMSSGCTQRGGSVVCGTANYVFFPSPISLRWSDAPETKQFAFARFSLSGATKEKVVVWKASSDLPLLVYDPEHKGAVTSATQVFGNVFQGGRDGREPWLDGYEALGSLDTNGDAKIAEQELSPLALWFDENRDGVSQPGEVKPLNHHEVNVTALFYEGGERNDVTNDIDLKVGFERIFGGRIEQGSSVDWYAEEASSQFELMSSLGIDSYFKRAESGGNAAVAPNSLTSSPRQTVAAYHMFLWRSEDPVFLDGDARKPQGILSVVELPDGAVRGHLIGESLLRENNAAFSRIDAVKLVGKIERSGDGARRVTFEAVKESPDGIDVRSTAVISKDGSEVQGITEETLTYEGRERTFSYTWKGMKE